MERAPSSLANCVTALTAHPALSGRRKNEDIMPKAVWNNQVIAESDSTEMVEGNHYFPKGSVKDEFLRPSDMHTTCPWKGKASYYTLEVDGQSNPDAAWTYPEPKEAAANIRDHVAFWRGVTVTD